MFQASDRKYPRGVVDELCGFSGDSILGNHLFTASGVAGQGEDWSAVSSFGMIPCRHQRIDRESQIPMHGSPGSPYIPAWTF